jgi:hypothetical protein
METLKNIFITLALVAGVMFLFAEWYIILAIATIFSLYFSVKAYSWVRRTFGD